MLVNAQRNCWLANGSGRRDDDGVPSPMKSINSGDAVAGDSKVSVTRKQGWVRRELINSVGLAKENFQINCEVGEGFSSWGEKKERMLEVM